MKSIVRRLIVPAMLVFLVQSPIPCLTQSINLPDTLVLKTIQVKGPGLMYYMSSIHKFIFFTFNSRTEDSIGYEVILPDNINHIEIDGETVDYSHQKGVSRKDNTVCFLKGIKGKDTILIVDENNNKDFRDDPIRKIEKLDMFSKANLFKCDYKIFNGKKYVTNSNWIHIGTWKYDGLWFLTNQHYTAKFKLQKSTYDIEIFIEDTRFSFLRPQIALVGANGVKRDTVLEGEILKEGEYLKLKEGIYKFAKLTNDGSYITLVREDHYQDISGTQIGVIAPAFKCHTTNGDSVSLEDYKGSTVLLVNISACYSVPGSQEVFKDLAEKYGSKLDMVVIDRAGGYLKQIENWNLPGKLVNADTPENIQFAKIYRPEYCSRTCFLIGADSRVIDKFEIFDWAKNLPKHKL